MVGLEAIPHLIAGDVKDFRNWLDRGYLRTIKSVPNKRGAWKFSKLQLLEIALVGALDNIFSKKAAVRRYINLEELRGLERGAEWAQVLWIAPETESTLMTPASDSIKDVSKALALPARGWVGDDQKPNRPAAYLVRIDLVEILRRVDAVIEGFAQGQDDESDARKRVRENA